MTKDMTGARAQIRNVIDTYGSNIQITPITVSYDSYGDKTETDGTPVDVKAIPFEYFRARYNFQPVGDIQEGDFIMIIRDDETIAMQSSTTIYKVVLDDTAYLVESIEDFDLADITLAKQVILRKRL